MISIGAIGTAYNNSSSIMMNHHRHHHHHHVHHDAGPHPEQLHHQIIRTSSPPYSLIGVSGNRSRDAPSSGISWKSSKALSKSLCKP
jgi:hypothetical protein